MKLFSRNCKALFSMGLILLLCQAPNTIADAGDSLMVHMDGSRLHSLPSSTGTILDSLPGGQILTEVSRKKEWIRVKLKNRDLEGWVYASNVKTVIQGVKPSSDEVNKTSLEQQLNLAQLGYQKGILFEGSSANHARKLYFHVPQDIAVHQGLFRIHYLYSPLLESHSNLRVYVNGSPRKIVRLNSDLNSGWLDIKLSQSDLSKRFIQVELKSAMLISKDRCFDERIDGAYLQILPDTNLQWQLQGEIASVRSYWQLLPRHVQVSLPQEPLNEELFARALGLTRQLILAGHQVSFTRLPTMGDIAIAPAEKITEWMQNKYKELPANSLDKMASDKNIAVIKLPDRQLLALWGSHDNLSLSFLSDNWRDLAAAGEYRIYTGSNQGMLADDRYAIRLQDLGMDTGAIDMSEQASWSTTINPSQLPPGHRLDKVRLELITAPSTTNKPVMFYVYLNGVLLKAVRLKDSGESQELILSFPRQELQRSNNLHFVAQRDLSDIDINCTSEPMRFPVQIKPQSTVETVLDASAPEQFAQLPAYLSRGYDTYLPQSYLQQADTVLPYLASMLSDMDLPLMVERLHFYKAEDKLSPHAPFILLGKADVSFDHQAVRYGKGRIDILNQQGNVLLAIDALPKISIAQIVRKGNAHGLWLLPPQGGLLVPVKDMHLSNDDVAFADANGILLTLDSSQPGLARVKYPDSASWFELFGEYRFWYFAIGWLLLTSLIIYLYRLSRSHRKN